MSKRFELLVFDWDGTLMDSTTIIVESLRSACTDLGFPVPTHEQASYIIGLGLHDAMAHILPGVDAAEYPRVVERYGHHFRLRDAETPLFPGVGEALHALKAAGHKLAVATGKSRRGLDRALAKTELATVFHATRCGEEAAGKPHPAMLHDLLAMLDVSAPSALMVGDTTHDLQMAINAGMSSVAVTYGAHKHQQLARLQPLACIESPLQLWTWLSCHA